MLRHGIFPTALLKLASVFHPTHSPAASLRAVGTCNPHRGCSLITWPCGKGGLHSWAPQDCNNWKDSFWQATTLRTLYREQMETHHQSSCGKVPFNVFWSFNLRDRFRVCHTFMGYRSTLRECKQGDTVLAHSCGLATVQEYLPERRLYSCLEPQFF